MKKVVLRHRTIIIAIAHVFMVCFSYTGAFMLRFDGVIPADYVGTFLKTLPLIVLIKFLALAYFRLFQGLWRYVSLNDIIDIFKAMCLSSAAFVLCVVFLPLVDHVPRSVYVIDWGVSIMFIGGIRLFIRIIRQAFRPVEGEPDKRVIIVGAGDTGEMTLRELLHHPNLGYEPIGFVDNNPGKRGAKIHGIPVIGGSEEVGDVIRKHDIDEVIIAIPSATKKQIRDIVERSDKTGVKFKILPGMHEIISGKVEVNQLREVELDDLLGRDPVKLDEGKVKENIAWATVMITGAGGSIGSELARQIASHAPSKLILFERNENNLFYIDMEMRESCPNVECIPVAGDILDRKHIDDVLSTHQPSAIFHAAAYKHVPMMEFNAIEAVKNNVLGTRGLAESAMKHGVRKFVFISTDKAVRPCNVMGATKRAAELVISDFGFRIANSGSQKRGEGGKVGKSESERVREGDYEQRITNHESQQSREPSEEIREPSPPCGESQDTRPTQFVAVRFGNVLGSNGSVVPLFKKQIAMGGPVTVTDPQVVRYFMTIPEAVELVLEAGIMGKDGEIFVLDMGEPVKIVDLARNLIELSGLVPREDIEIKFTGLRPGEKLREELLIEGEEIVPTSQPKIMVFRGNDLPDSARIMKMLDELAMLVEARDEEGVIGKLKEIVPEYQERK